MMIKRKHSIEITGLKSYSNDADALRKALESVPSGAKFDIDTHEGDYHMSDTYSIEFEWEEQV